MADTDEFDLDAAEAEITRADYRFRWGGRGGWRLINAFKLPADLIGEAMSGDFEVIMRALRTGMGDEQYAEFVAVGKRINLDAVKILFNRWTDHAGLDEGESSGSGTSSPSMAEPSKPTFTPTTGSDSIALSSVMPNSGTPVGSF